MKINKLKPRKALNKAFLKVKPNRTDIEGFKANLIALLDRTNDTESEEFHKNLVSDFLKDTYYKQTHFINTKGRNDLVIHNGNTSASTVGVILEAKKPTNKNEMVTAEKLNAKAFQELVLYYLRERISHNNLEVKHLIITNITEWFIFDAALFDRLFAQNKSLVKQFTDFEGGRLSGTKTDFFYKQIAEPYIEGLTAEIEFTHFNLQEYQRPLRNDDKRDDTALIALFKLLSPEHLLKLPFTNDSNSLDKRFYSELLHIIGLTETKEGGKKLIGRNKEGERNTGSILEDAIIQLDSLDKIGRMDRPSQYGATHQERLFTVALELSITWINRILFLKLLEAQLITYHRGDTSYAFLSLDKVKSFDDLNSLFFQVLARQHHDRNEDVKKTFERVPYLNSSLFEPTDMEHVTFFISTLSHDKAIPIISSTVLKDEQGKKRTGKLSTLEYLFAFLNAYDFSSEGSEEIQEENKTLINASVLGLIFEKINGYKDGSIFTPGFITMYMSRETIRKAVVQKFNDAKGWNCGSFEELKEDLQEEIKGGNRKEVRKLANQIINSLKIIDPAVGSGHFLVSVLNELIAIKSELRILVDANYDPLSTYTVEVVNDELILTDDEGILFQYIPNNKESQRIQETLFHEKQTLIENCLFGVDINPNSVKICRLRLWIELLKNAYYKSPTELETLPNIDINIKCGNSLVSRFALDADLKQALKKSKWTIDAYRIAVDTYRNAENKEQKREMERLIADIKSDFRSEITKNDPKLKRKAQLAGELYNLTMQQGLFAEGEKQKKERLAKVAKLETALNTLETEIEEIKANKIFENAFEWRFEFPEVLNDDGYFVGFDVVIGNPPYVQIQKMDFDFDSIKSKYETFEQTGDIYALFYEKGLEILTSYGILSFITSNKWLRANYGQSLRQFFCSNTNCLQLIDFNYFQVFPEASVDTNILSYSHGKTEEIDCAVLIEHPFELERISEYVELNKIKVSNLSSSYWSIIPAERSSLNEKLKTQGKHLKEWCIEINRGILTGFNDAFIIDSATKDELLKVDSKNAEVIVPYLRGRDTRRYGLKHEDLWLINTHNGVKELNIPPTNVETDYPSIFEYLSKFRPKIEKRSDKGNHWSNLRNCAYLKDFEKEKMIYAETMRVHKNDLSNFPRFGFDDESFYCDKTTFIATGDHIKYLLGVLNSNLGRYLIKEYVTKLDTGGYMMQKSFLEVIPIKVPSPDDQKGIETLVQRIIETKKIDGQTDTSDLESQIDQLVYQLYDFTKEEIKIIEGS